MLVRSGGICAVANHLPFTCMKKSLPGVTEGSMLVRAPPQAPKVGLAPALTEGSAPLPSQTSPTAVATSSVLFDIADSPLDRQFYGPGQAARDAPTRRRTGASAKWTLGERLSAGHRRVRGRMEKPWARHVPGPTRRPVRLAIASRTRGRCGWPDPSNSGLFVSASGSYRPLRRRPGC